MAGYKITKKDEYYTYTARDIPSANYADCMIPRM